MSRPAANRARGSDALRIRAFFVPHSSPTKTAAFLRDTGVPFWYDVGQWKAITHPAVLGLPLALRVEWMK
jgi:hypothetical protein